MSGSSEKSAEESRKEVVEIEDEVEYKSLYTTEEDQIMVEYFIKNKWHHKIGGTKPYQIMVDEKLFKNRSAKSLRSRFQKIVKRLYNYEMSEEDRQKFLKRRATNKFKVKKQENNWIEKYSTCMTK